MHWKIWGMVGLLGLAPSVYADVSGNVFRDINANGVLDTSSTFNEKPVSGITVKAFDATGAEVATALTNATGDYTLAGVTGAVRLEFSSLLTGDYSSSPGTGDGSNVRFVSAPATGINYALNYPADYCVADPKLLVPVHYAGDGTGTNSANGGLHSFPYSTSGNYSPNNVIELTKAELGSVWGVAYDKPKKRVFEAAFLKRHVGLKGGLGDISISETQVDNSLDYIRSFSLQGVTASNTGTVIDLGTVCRSAACATDAGNTGIATDYIIPPEPMDRSIDLDAFPKIGKVGFGGLEITPDNKYLWAVNLYQRSLLKMETGLATAAFPGNVQAYAIEDASGVPSCTGGVLRPFALSFYRDKGYLGGVCDASVSKQTSDLVAYVLAFDPNASNLAFSTVTSFKLDYNRGSDWYDAPNWSYYYWQWHPWTDDWNEFGLEKQETIIAFYAVPLLADIAFSDDGSMTVALMDRFSHQTGNLQYRAISQTSQVIAGRSRGDLVHFCKDAAGVFHAEGSTECPINNSTYVEGLQNTGEYFNDVSGDSFSEGILGSVLSLSGRNEMVATIYDPFAPGLASDNDSVNTVGLHHFNLTNGERASHFRVAASNISDGGFGKSSALGELEVLCPPAPIELGNRVWVDKDKDGIQDADEAGLEGVNVSLVCPSGSATTLTDSNGQFVFTNASSGNASFLQAGESCKLDIDNSQAVLKTYQLTAANAEGDSSNTEQTDLRDSDAQVNGSHAELAITVGANNHSLDFGYREPVVTDLAIEKVVTPSQAKHGESVIYKLTVTNQSSVAATNVQIKDQLPAGLSYLSDDGLATYGSDVFDESTGVWAVGTMAAGVSKILQITVQVQ